ncbi:glycosyltransferase [Deinococcus hopiensis]|uniref:Glycosyltransferases, probably involved in cell wall biogenesis n=1 Tax=Deinococcus hopiensis KR-140 TaxID=695939 RepID=A0A1W1VR96_9DEIO|nr:glycosyltransferase family 2 protein [Deinococcus hopiensis]SMB95902.1 Glycosyltransferases, probably involved in cell wall biogenesis [Deinococcus hopiensis KR-140]
MRWALSALLTAFFGYKAASLLVNAFAFPRLEAQPTPAGAARVSLLVPARNESHNLPHLLPGLLAQGAGEVIVLDDASTDGTAQVARALGARVRAGRPLPPGWHGKPWACQQLAEAARGEVLIFTDADVRWHPGALGAVLRELERSGADLLSVYPRQQNVRPGERLLTPLVDAVLLTLLPAPLLRLPQRSASAANGQLMAFHRAAYEWVGGHSLVREALLEDVAFAQGLKARGGRLALALGGDVVGVRMYRSYTDSVEGFGKNAFSVHGRSHMLMAASFSWHLAAYTLPWLLPARGRPGVWVWRAATVLERSLVNLLTGRRTATDLAEGLLGPVTPLLTLPVYLRAMRRRVTWKGRAYEQ